MSDSPAMHLVVQVTRLTGLGAGTNPPGLPEGGRVFLGPDDQAGVTLELDSLEAATRLLAQVQDVVDRLHEVGRLIGIAFQLVDDVLGIVGDPAVTGKSASSDVRAGKRSVPVVVSLRGDSRAARELELLLADGPPSSDGDVARAAELIEQAGGVAWAGAEAERLLDEALALLDTIPLADAQAGVDLREVAEYLIRRNR